MKTFTLYHRASGAVLAVTRVPDNQSPDAYESIEVGVYDGPVNPDTEYVVDATMLGPRTDAVGLSAPPSAETGTLVTVTGLPDPCWAYVAGNLVALTGGSASFTPQAEKTYTLVLAGRYRGAVSVRVEATMTVAVGADPRWQALKTATPQQITNWVAANVTDLASAKNVLTTLLLAVRLLYDKSQGE